MMPETNGFKPCQKKGFLMVNAFPYFQSIPKHQNTFVPPPLLLLITHSPLNISIKDPTTHPAPLASPEFPLITHSPHLPAPP